jgi:hypothetical protein
MFIQILEDILENGDTAPCFFNLGTKCRKLVSFTFLSLLDNRLIRSQNLYLQRTQPPTSGVSLVTDAATPAKYVGPGALLYSQQQPIILSINSGTCEYVGVIENVSDCIY